MGSAEEKRGNIMQKRTNPLALKVEEKDYSPAPATVKSADENTQQAEPAAVEQAPAYREPVSEAPKPVAPAPAPQPIPQPVPQPAPAAQTVQESVATQPAPQSTEPVAVSAQEPIPTPVQPVAPMPSAPAAPQIAPAPVVTNVNDGDTKVAVRFRLTGNIKRRAVLVRVNNNVLQLAQALYPEQSTGTVIENALLTRCFLQDRDAFDEMAREILKKGGKIKC